MGVSATSHGRADTGNTVDVWDLIVHETETKVKVLWQDGTIEDQVPAKELIPYLNVDESETWFVFLSSMSLCCSRKLIYWINL